MMERLIRVFIVLLFTMTPCFAQNVVVESLTDFAKEDEEVLFSAKILEQAELESGFVLEENGVITGKIIKVTDAKRGKRSGYIVIRPTVYQDKQDGEIKNIEEEDLRAKVVGYSKRDFKETAFKAGLAVGGHFVKGLGQIFYFSKGLIIPDKDKTRIETAVHNVYENTPFVYIEKGAEVDINKGDKLVLKIKSNKKD